MRNNEELLNFQEKDQERQDSCQHRSEVESYKRGTKLTLNGSKV